MSLDVRSRGRTETLIAKFAVDLMLDRRLRRQRGLLL